MKKVYFYYWIFIVVITFTISAVWNVYSIITNYKLRVKSNLIAISQTFEATRLTSMYLKPQFDDSINSVIVPHHIVMNIPINGQTRKKVLGSLNDKVNNNKSRISIRLVSNNFENKRYKP